MLIRLAGLAGTFSRSSQTRALVDLVALRAAARFGATVATYDLGDLGTEFGKVRSLGDLPPLPRAIMGSVLSADALIVGCPSGRDGATRLFQRLFNLIDPAMLAGKPVLRAEMTGHDPWPMRATRLSQPLSGLRAAATLPEYVRAGSTDLADGRTYSATLLTRIDAAVDQFAPWLTGAARAA